MTNTRIPRWSKVALATAALALPLVACGDDDDVDDGVEDVQEGTEQVEEGTEEIQEGVEDSVQDAVDEADEEMADTSE